MAQKPEVSILIVNQNNRDLTCSLLETIYKKSTGFTYEIIVVDNASNDGSVELLSLKYPSVINIKNETRLGFATNCNKAIVKSKGKYLVLLNNDMLLLNNAFLLMKKFLEEKKKAGAVGCKLFNEDMTIQPSAWINFPSLGTELLISTLLFLLLEKISKGKGYPFKYAMSLSEFYEQREVAYLLGACIMIKRETIDDVGLLDETTIAYREETDLCHRMKLKGWKVFYIPDGEIIHYGGKTIKRNSTYEVDLGLKAAYYYHKKYYGGFSTLLLSILYNIGAIIRIGLHSILYALDGDTKQKNATIVKNSAYLLLWHLRMLKKLTSNIELRWKTGG